MVNDSNYTDFAIYICMRNGHKWMASRTLQHMHALSNLHTQQFSRFDIFEYAKWYFDCWFIQFIHSGCWISGSCVPWALICNKVKMQNMLGWKWILVSSCRTSIVFKWFEMWAVRYHACTWKSFLCHANRWDVVMFTTCNYYIPIRLWVKFVMRTLHRSEIILSFNNSTSQIFAFWMYTWLETYVHKSVCHSIEQISLILLLSVHIYPFIRGCNFI